MSQDPTPNVHSGLEGIVAAETHLSHVDGLQGQLTIAGFPVEVLAPTARFEEVLALLWTGRLPSQSECRDLDDELRSHRALPRETLRLLEEAARQHLDPMDALRMGAASLSLDSTEAELRPQAVRAVAALPTLVAAFRRLLDGQEPVRPADGLGHVANLLYMLEGREPGPGRVRALETYLNTVVDHGMNASTFTARVIMSTHSDVLSAVVGAIGALKGPLHGGAPGPALDMVFEIGEPEHAEEVIRRKLESGERLMGFGHRVYKVRDPRADVLSEAADQLARDGGNRELHELARAVEKVALRLLEESKPGRRLQTNVEYYTALLLHSIGLDQTLFTPCFAVGRVAGWTAHCFEQLRTGRLIRPSCLYVGPRDGVWVPIEAR